jgi:hypothetical protein
MRHFFLTLWVCSLALAGSAQTMINVTWQVDMSEVGANPAGVFVAGSFQGWTAGASQMTDPDGNGIFTYTQQVEAGTYIMYKFMNGPGWSWVESVPAACGNTADNNNRFITLGTSDTVLPVVCYSDCVACNEEIPTVPVTFRVDMSQQTVSANGVHVAGSMQGWNPGGTQLSDANGDGIYEVTLQLAAASYQYKFVNGNAWGGDEAVPSACATNSNREAVVGSSPVTVTSCFGQCTQTCAAPTPSADITFSVNASLLTVDPSGMWLAGSFTSPTWQAGSVAMSDADGDGVWTATVNVSGSAEIAYKFFNGDPYVDGQQVNAGEETANFSAAGCGASNGVGGYNRIHTRTGQPEVLPTVCFNYCTSCPQGVPGCTDSDAVNYDADATADDGSCQFLVTLRVNMSNTTVNAAGVHVAGGFQGWNPGSTAVPYLGFGVYELTVSLTNGTHEYKFVNGNAWGGDESVSGCGNGGNRTVTVNGGNVVTAAACFGNCDACAGCTDPFSLEFDPFAGSDDGSCDTPRVLGCTYEEATNYNPAANIEDGSCIVDAANPCPGDLNEDGVVGTPDLLVFLAAFGTDCD